MTLVSCSTYSFQQDIDNSKSPKSFSEKVDSIVVNKMNEYSIPGLSIGLVRNDSITYTKGYGVKSIENTDAVTENSIFHTASISKMFTALAVVQLFESRQLSIDEKLTDIVPALDYNDIRVREVTIKQLLNHTSGLPDIGNYHWGNNKQADSSLGEYILEYDLKLESTPGSEYRYSNLAYDILGYVVEKVSGTSFENYVNKSVLASCGMLDSDFRYFNIQDSLRTSPHSKRWMTKSIYKRKIYPYTREHAPSSTLNSSSKDLSNWMISFLQSLNDPQANSGLLTMTSPSFDTYPYIGLGFQLSKIDSKRTIGHYGGDRGFRSYLVMIPEEKIGLVLLANCDYNEDFRQEILHTIARLMLSAGNSNN